jgi:UDPglucose 6-dehydrogenase
MSENTMKVLIIGTGYVGTTTGLVLCEMGHKVTGLDIDEHKVRNLQNGKLHFYEPGLEELLIKHTGNGNINFTNNYNYAIKENDVIFICVGTPQGEDGGADLSYVRDAAISVGENLNSYKVIVNKSTVPVGTAALVSNWIKEKLESSDIEFDVVSNPEFLREGSALEDAFYPDRIVIGCANERSCKIMKELYSEFQCPIIETNPKAAELIKYAANSFLALKISFINEIALLCNALNINVKDISKGIGSDHRIGQYFLSAGIGYGGSCFPKDVNELIYTANKNNIRLSIMESAVKTNQLQPIHFLDKVITSLGTLKNKKISVLGLSFKANTDDTRESPSIKIIDELIEWEAKVNVHDPVVNKINRLDITHCSTIEECLYESNAVIICTDWPEYKNINWMKMKDIMQTPYIFDGRNMLNPVELKEIGFIYKGIGLG